MDKLLVASEYTEPSFFAERITEGLVRESKTNKCGLLLITKDIAGSTPIWKKAKELGIPTITHVTITGLGGTTLEPRVKNWVEACQDLIYFASTYAVENLSDLVLRIDPLIPKVSDFSVIDKILNTAFQCGIHRCRISVVDYYQFVRDKFLQEKIPLTSSSIEPPLSLKTELLMKLAELCIGKYGMSLESCAEDIDIPGLEKVGCADRNEWKSLGLDLPLGNPKRPTCFCNVTKYDLLSHEPTCGYNCLYCYWGRNR